jgi:hypothetical protein
LSRSGQNQTADGGKPPGRLRQRHKTDSGDFAARSIQKEPVDAASHRQRFSHSLGLADFLQRVVGVDAGCAARPSRSVEARHAIWTFQLDHKVYPARVFEKGLAI